MGLKEEEGKSCFFSILFILGIELFSRHVIDSRWAACQVYLCNAAVQVVVCSTGGVFSCLVVGL